MTVTWFFVGLLTGGMLGMLLMALLASAAHADDVAELKAKADYCDKWHQWSYTHGYTQGYTRGDT